mmetsp:Transcript_32101/g.97841  ORF Transcript_32101/g.97841 Transcript_32101/m.97841 type:complete len:225 (-) Transcript_32101:39-713(-)
MHTTHEPLGLVVFQFCSVCLEREERSLVPSEPTILCSIDTPDAGLHLPDQLGRCFAVEDVVHVDVMRDNVTTGLAHQRYQRRATSVPHPNCAQLAHLREKLAPLQPLQVQPVVLPRHPPRALRRDRRAFCGRVERLTPAPEQFRHMPILVACRRLMRGEQVWGISWIIFRNEAEAVERAEGGQPSADRRAAGLLDVVEEDHEATGQPWRGARHAAVARQAAAAA